MCRRVTCKSCGRPSFAGCGMHVEQVLAGVPKSQRCSCAADAGAAKASGSAGSAGSGSGSWFSRLWRRN
ncbi:hypothetical protein [Kitasatospora phosalacinea]|uniref:hypothetical protein n=1 Tax=Kitasatospora phosalacinea TaxID=2065 RepID=UPI0005269F9F|nr:hypothetical protein [Kitasatospora phosalacinea]